MIDRLMKPYVCQGGRIAHCDQQRQRFVDVCQRLLVVPFVLRQCREREQRVAGAPFIAERPQLIEHSLQKGDSFPLRLRKERQQVAQRKVVSGTRHGEQRCWIETS